MDCATMARSIFRLNPSKPSTESTRNGQTYMRNIPTPCQTIHYNTARNDAKPSTFAKQAKTRSKTASFAT